MGNLLQDLRHGTRVLRKSPAFAAVAVFTLALGISANATVFTWIDGVLLNPLPGAADVHRLVAFETILQNGEFSNTSYRDHLDYRDSLKLVAGLALWTQCPFSVGEGDSPERVWGELISGSYFSVLGIKPALGRLFAPDPRNDAPGAHPVAVISDRMWRSRFGADPRVVGRTVRVNRHELTIIGVAPRVFRGGTAGLSFDIWVPLTMASELKASDRYLLTSRKWRGLFAIARLNSGVALEAARAEVRAMAGALAAEYPNTNRGIGATLLPLSESPTGAQALLKRPLAILMAVCGIVIMIACANVANLLLARSVARQDFEESDDETHMPVMIVNQAFARRFFHDAYPIGRKVKVSAGKVFTVVGMAKDIKYRSLAESPQPYFYMSIRQRLQEGRNIAFLLRTSGNPGDVIAAVAREASGIDPAAASVASIPLAEYITASLYPQKIAARLLSVLGLVCLFLSTVGLYGVVSYAVSQRTHEIGIRMALGAQPADIVGMVLRQGMLLTASGLAIGIACAIALTRLVANMLVAVNPADPATLVVSAMFLGIVSLLATYFPARRARMVDPIVALRQE